MMNLQIAFLLISFIMSKFLFTINVLYFDLTKMCFIGECQLKFLYYINLLIKGPIALQIGNNQSVLKNS